MTPEVFHQTAMGLPGATFDIKWGVDRTYCVGAKMFAASGPTTDPTPRYSFKASDMAFELLIEQGLARPTAYSARFKWVTLVGPDALPDEELTVYLAQAHAIVAAGLPKKTRLALGLIE
jgi:predicted DNA-binding protein (MmcQ/YjbR family)